MSDKIISGNIDSFGYIFITTSIINNENGIRIDDIKTIIDTGAFSSFIQKDIVKQLQLKVYRENKYNNPIGGQITTNAYLSSLIFNTTQYNNFLINEFTTNDYHCGILIGMDFLKNCELTFSVKNKTFELVFKLVVSATVKMRCGNKIVACLQDIVQRQKLSRLSR